MARLYLASWDEDAPLQRQRTYSRVSSPTGLAVPRVPSFPGARWGTRSSRGGEIPIVQRGCEQTNKHNNAHGFQAVRSLLCGLLGTEEVIGQRSQSHWNIPEMPLVPAFTADATVCPAGGLALGSPGTSFAALVPVLCFLP